MSLNVVGCDVRTKTLRFYTSVTGVFYRLRGSSTVDLLHLTSVFVANLVVHLDYSIKGFLIDSTKAFKFLGVEVF